MSTKTSVAHGLARIKDKIYSLEELIQIEKLVDLEPMNIDNDNIFMYFNGDCIYSSSPEETLIESLKLLGLKAKCV